MAPGLPSWNRTDAAVASRIRRVATERVEVSPETDVTKYVVFPHDPANVWRQTAEAKNQQPSSKTRDPLRPQTTLVRQEDHKARIANQRGGSSLQRARTPLPELTDKSLESQL